MNILVTGASGLVGSALVPFLSSHAHRVIRLVRTGPKPGAEEILWDPEAGWLDPVSLDGLDAVVHLAGESIASGRWTLARKGRILDSRANGTRLLARTLAAVKRAPKVLVSTSAVGYYGDRGAEILREESGPGSGFLTEVCRQWEQAAREVTERGIRLVVLRLGMILSSAGGALPRMLPPFRLGAGGPLGSGNQYVSWIALGDLLAIVLFALADPSLQGVVNAVAPNPATNREFARTLGRVLKRPAMIPVPAFAIRLLFGEMGEQVLLASSRVEPTRLIAAGFQFRYPDLETALRHELAR